MRFMLICALFFMSFISIGFSMSPDAHEQKEGCKKSQKASSEVFTIDAQALLNLAIYDQKEALAEVAIRAGASLYKAVRYCRSCVMLELLLRHGLPVDGIIPDLGATLLYYFINPAYDINPREKYAMISVILLMGAHPDFIIQGKDLHGKPYRTTALHCAVAVDSFEIMKLLLDYGASMCITDHSGETPYHIALRRELYDIVEYFDGVAYRRNASMCGVSRDNQQVVSGSSSNYSVASSIDLKTHGYYESKESASTTAASVSAAQVITVVYGQTSSSQPISNTLSDEQKEHTDQGSVWLSRPSNLWRCVVDVSSDRNKQFDDHSQRKF